jgi:ADP-heptose:LPS heptosyltransferase
MNVLIVRLGALGDIVHTIPAAAALRAAFPDAHLTWLVDAKHRSIVDLVEGIDRVVVVPTGTPAGWLEAVRQLRRVPCDVALDFQGLMKSAVFARASGARRVIGFSIWHLREKTARPFYSETIEHEGVRLRRNPSRPDEEPHVIHKNLRLLRTVGVSSDRVLFPLAHVETPALRDVRAALGAAPFALINPGAAWPNKRWPAERFGEAAVFLRDVRGLRTVVLWGPGEDVLARAVVDASSGAARLAPPTNVADLLALSRDASVMLSGDTGPLHIAGAAGTPIVAVFGPTDPARNGPWSAEDIVVSRHAVCGCHYDRRCHQPQWCLADVSVAEVTAAIQQRLQ